MKNENKEIIKKAGIDFLMCLAKNCDWYCVSSEHDLDLKFLPLEEGGTVVRELREYLSNKCGLVRRTSAGDDIAIPGIDDGYFYRFAKIPYWEGFEYMGEYHSEYILTEDETLVRTKSKDVDALLELFSEFEIKEKIKKGFK